MAQAKPIHASDNCAIGQLAHRSYTPAIDNRRHACEDAMRKRHRKLIGTVVMVAFVCTYAMLAMALSQGRITEASQVLRVIWYAFLGLFWVVPLLPLIRWMERPDPGEEPPQRLPR